MPDEEMIERCAKAGYDKFNEDLIGDLEPYWKDLPQDFKDRMKDGIIAIIKAMREPTEKMFNAADVGMQSDLYPPDMTWQIMIDEILK